MVPEGPSSGGKETDKDASAVKTRKPKNLKGKKGKSSSSRSQAQAEQEVSDLLGMLGSKQANLLLLPDIQRKLAKMKPEERASFICTAATQNNSAFRNVGGILCQNEAKQTTAVVLERCREIFDLRSIKGAVPHEYSRNVVEFCAHLNNQKTTDEQMLIYCADGLCSDIQRKQNADLPEETTLTESFDLLDTLLYCIQEPNTHLQIAQRVKNTLGYETGDLKSYWQSTTASICAASMAASTILAAAAAAAAITAAKAEDERKGIPSVLSFDYFPFFPQPLSLSSQSGLESGGDFEGQSAPSSLVGSPLGDAAFKIASLPGGLLRSPSLEVPCKLLIPGALGSPVEHSGTEQASRGLSLFSASPHENRGTSEGSDSSGSQESSQGYGNEKGTSEGSDSSGSRGSGYGNGTVGHSSQESGSQNQSDSDKSETPAADSNDNDNDNDNESPLANDGISEEELDMRLLQVEQENKRLAGLLEQKLAQKPKLETERSTLMKENDFQKKSMHTLKKMNKSLSAEVQELKAVLRKQVRALADFDEAASSQQEQEEMLQGLGHSQVTDQACSSNVVETGVKHVNGTNGIGSVNGGHKAHKVSRVWTGNHNNGMTGRTGVNSIHAQTLSSTAQTSSGMNGTTGVNEKISGQNGFTWVFNGVNGLTSSGTSLCGYNGCSGPSNSLNNTGGLNSLNGTQGKSGKLGRVEMHQGENC